MPAPPPPLAVLYEDNHLLVIDKPAGLPTMGGVSGPTAHALAARYLKDKYAKPGNVFVGIVSRLDAMTSGVLVLARTSKAAARLSQQFRESRPGKRYLAVVEGRPHPAAGSLADTVYKDDAAHRMRCAQGQAVASGQAAELHYETLATRGDRALLAIALITGRKHQIRVQWASRGHPVWGDRKYEAVSRMKRGIALHAWQLTIEHPTRKEPMTFLAPPPPAWQKLGFAASGSGWRATST